MPGDVPRHFLCESRLNSSLETAGAIASAIYEPLYPTSRRQGLFAGSLTNICLLIIIKLESTPYLMV